MKHGFIFVTLFAEVTALDNGVATTPPLGWMTWQRYRCQFDCNSSTARNCVNERLIKETADAMVAGGYKEAGYEYVAIDDCWQAPYRVNGHLVPDPHRFPNGMKALAEYVHAKGLKFGLYTAVGNFTCAGSHYATDATGLGCDYDKIPECTVARRDIEDLVSWGIDHLKVDGCRGFDEVQMNGSYAIIGNFLHDAAARRGGDPVLYHPSNLGFKFPRQFRELASIANQWRFFDDVQDTWASVRSIIEELGAGQPQCLPGPLPSNCSGKLHKDLSIYCASHCSERDAFLAIAGRGGWHDPDMLLVGNTPCPGGYDHGPAWKRMRCNSLTHDEEQTQMAIWAMHSAPLMMSNDLTNIPDSSRAILLNKEVLAIDQDLLGRMPFRFRIDADAEVHLWRKELVSGAVAVAIVNMHNSTAVPVGFSFALREVGFSPDTHVSVRNVYTGEDLGWQKGSVVSAAEIPPHGVQLLRLSYAPQYPKQVTSASKQGRWEI